MSTLAAPALATAPLVSLRPVPRPGSLPPPATTEIVARAKHGGVTAYHEARADGSARRLNAGYMAVGAATDTGPFVEDVFWLINREQERLWIPQEAAIFSELLELFQELDGFKN